MIINTSNHGPIIFFKDPYFYYYFFYDNDGEKTVNDIYSVYEIKQ